MVVGAIEMSATAEPLMNQAAIMSVNRLLRMN